MKAPLVCITSVIKNRAWALKHFLGAILALDYPKDRLILSFVDDASTDGTRELLEAFKVECAGQFANIYLCFNEEPLDNATSARDTIDRQAGYPHLAALRNEALEMALAAKADYQFSIDSDILVSPGILHGLLQHKLPYLASIIFNDIDSDRRHIAIGTSILSRITNCGKWEGGKWRHWTIKAASQYDQLMPCGYSGAVYLVDKATLKSGARFGVNPLNGQACEDYAYCWALQERGIPRHIDTTLRAVHLQIPACLQEGVAVYYAWFGQVLVPWEPAKEG